MLIVIRKQAACFIFEAPLIPGSYIFPGSASISSFSVSWVTARSDIHSRLTLTFRYCRHRSPPVNLFQDPQLSIPFSVLPTISLQTLTCITQGQKHQSPDTYLCHTGTKAQPISQQKGAQTFTYIHQPLSLGQINPRGQERDQKISQVNIVS